jgi:hypothetical protein
MGEEAKVIWGRVGSTGGGLQNCRLRVPLTSLNRWQNITEEPVYA